jgi:hypothetical protein
MSGAIKAIGSLFKAPKVEKQELPPMPDPESPAAKLEAVKKLRRRAQGGREGTIYSGAYSNQALGGTS